MKKIMITAMLLCSFSIIKAQANMRRDTANTSMNTQYTDSAKRGNVVFDGAKGSKSQGDTLSGQKKHNHHGTGTSNNESRDKMKKSNSTTK